MKKLFTIKLTYFKPSGKYYTDAKFQREFRALEDGSVNMHDVIAHVRGNRDNGGQGAMPGLSEFRDGWDGAILVDCDDGYPHLLMPPIAR